MTIVKKLCYILFYCFALIFITPKLAVAQSHSSDSYRYLIDTLTQKKLIERLTSREFMGRGAGTEGAAITAEFIEQEFKEYGLESYKGISYIQEFKLPIAKESNTKIGRNIVGFIPAKEKNSKFIIIGAHYDHIGTINGRLFPGADDNASGVISLLQLAKAFGKRYLERGKGDKNILFVAFDANNISLSGSRYFVERLGGELKDIECMINIDQIGSNLSPPSTDSTYILILGSNKLKEWQKERIDSYNTRFKTNLHIDYTYYNSESFYNIFYKISDQNSFAEMGVPALLFTSGITKLTNKEEDNISNISFDTLYKRILLIYRFIWSL